MYELDTPRDFDSPVLVVAFEGWVSAGSAGTATADHVVGDGPVIARFRSDDLYDYRVNRPTIDFQDGVLDAISWPETIVRHQTFDGRDVLVLTGPEPNWHWQAFADAVVSLSKELDVSEHISLGGIPWAAPHTRPTVIVTTAGRPESIPADGNAPEGLLRVPGAAVSVVESAAAEAGTTTIGFWARVPHYVAGVYHPAVVALTERLGSHLAVEIPLGSMVDDAAEQRSQLDAALEDQPNVREAVTQLETMYDAQGDVASGEEIAAEIERFLREQAGEDSE